MSLWDEAFSVQSWKRDTFALGQDVQWLPRTLHLCAAHVIHQMAPKLKFINGKSIKQFVVYLFDHLQNSTAIDGADILFKHSALDLGTKTYTTEAQCLVDFLVDATEKTSKENEFECTPDEETDQHSKRGLRFRLILWQVRILNPETLKAIMEVDVSALTAERSLLLLCM